MNEPTVHTFDLSAKVCYCGRVHAAPTHTITDAQTALDLMIRRERTKLTPVERLLADSVTEAAANLVLYGTPLALTLSPEWAERLWELARRPQRPSFEPSRKLRIRVDSRLPPDRIVPRYDFATHAAAEALLALRRIDG